VTLSHQVPPPSPRRQVSTTQPPSHAYAAPRKQVAVNPRQVSAVYGMPSRDPVAVSHVSRRAPVYDMASNVGKKSFYAGFGVAADVINPHGVSELSANGFFPLKVEFNNSASGVNLSPKIFIGVENLDCFKGYGFRFQAGADFHTIKLSNAKIVRGFDDGDALIASQAIMDYYFNYTFNLTAQVTKKLSDNLDGYLGLSLLATWAQISQKYTGLIDDLPINSDSGEMSRFILGASPQIGFIYRVSDKLFYYLDAHLSFYQRLSQEGIPFLIFRFNTRMTPQWGGISAGIGWKL